MNPSEIQRVLRKCDVFASAGDDDIAWLAEIAETKTLGPEQILFEEGDVASKVYVVAKGSLHVRLSESTKLVSFAEAGALFGEYAMFVKGVRTARVVAAEDCELLSFVEAAFREFLLRCPTVMMELLQTAVRRLERVERQRR